MAVNWNVFVAILLLLYLTTEVLPPAHAAVTAVYIFGDSIVDVGTNNNFNDSFATANFPYNGIDFPGGIPTGRFSNGFNTADFLSKRMGFMVSPKPYMDLIDNKTEIPTEHVMEGANFASAGAGIMPLSGKWLGENIEFTLQIEQFAAVRQKLEELLSQEETQTFFSKSMVFISIGSNDIFEYYMFVDEDPKKFISEITRRYEDHLRRLYSIGARKFGIISVPVLGCLPSQRSQNKTGGCVDRVNEYARLFYSTVEPMLQKLSSELKDMKYSLGNSYDMVNTLMANPLNFQELKNACCGSGDFSGEGICNVHAQLCTNRNKYLYWDWNHPTEAASKLLAEFLCNGSINFVKPINFKQLADA